jgi:hypothetical protein
MKFFFTILKWMNAIKRWTEYPAGMISFDKEIFDVWIINF